MFIRLILSGHFVPSKLWPWPVFKVKVTISTSPPVLDRPSRDLYVCYVWCQNSYGKCLKYDVKVIRLAPLSGKTIADIGNWSTDSCSPNRVPYGDVCRICGSNHASKIFAFEKRLKSPNMVREYAGTKLTSALCTVDRVVIVTPTQTYQNGK